MSNDNPIEPGSKVTLETDGAKFEGVVDLYPCPSHYPPDAWAAMPEGNKKAYLYALKVTKELTGGK